MVVHMIAAFLIAALSGMGVGGGGLFVVYLALFGETPQLTAQGMNLLFFLFSAGASMLVHLRQRHVLPLAVLLMAGTGIAGALLGSALAPHVNGDLLRKLFGGMLVVSGILALQRKERSEESGE
ncbi:MAG: sulfite exporter TauE/SafE family protein [Clostridia bacterium]|nr:sulfite exporter TauE/SafE family protein [Clostridia bacterium]